jgi:lysophospholipase L1-like esterase
MQGMMRKLMMGLAGLLLASAGLAEDLVWKPASELGVRGRGWPVAATAYGRLPVQYQGKVPDAVWKWGAMPAGLYVAFVSDSPRLSFRWAVEGEGTGLAMPHMPQTGVSGCDAYSRAADGSWRFIRIGLSWWQNPATVTVDIGTPGKDRPYVVFLPLYANLKSLEIGIPAGYTIDPADPFKEGARKPIVFYGTSITQGACASRAGMAFPSIVMRKLEWPVVNLGFNGAAILDEGTVGMIAGIDAQVYVIDALKNLRNQVFEQKDGARELRQRIRAAVKLIREKHPDTPILFVGESHYLEHHPTAVSKAQSEAIDELQGEGIKHLHVLPGADLLGRDGEGTTDGVHPNDLGMMRHALLFVNALKPLLPPPGK